MTLGTLIIWLVIGGIAGFVARQIMGGASPFGIIGDVILGIAGGIVGGYGLALLGVGGSGGLIGTFITATIGAVVLVWLSGKLKK